MPSMNRVIEQVDRIYPNGYSNRDKYAWLKELEGKIQCEVYGKTDCEYTIPEDADTQLSVLPPYDAIYGLYVMAMIDFFNREFDSYNNTLLLYRDLYNRFVAWYQQHNAKTEAANFRNVMG